MQRLEESGGGILGKVPACSHDEGRVTVANGEVWLAGDGPYSNIGDAGGPWIPGSLCFTLQAKGSCPQSLS